MKSLYIIAVAFATASVYLNKKSDAWGGSLSVSRLRDAVAGRRNDWGRVALKSHYAKKVQDDRRAMLNRGMIVGQQWAIDLMCISLHRLGWGYDRVKRLLERMEQDVTQERMDRELRDLIKDKQELIPFDKRYPDVKTLGYDKLPRR